MKRRKLLTNPIFLIMVGIPVAIGIYIGLIQIMDQSYRNLNRIILDPYVYPNMNITPEQTGNRLRDLLVSEATYTYTKEIEGFEKVVRTEVYNYNLWFKPRGKRQEFDDESVMRFFLPTYSYDEYPNDVNRLENLSNNVAEMAISFDRPYSIIEVENLQLPEGVHQTYYWVNTYDERNEIENEPQLEDGICGFQNYNNELEMEVVQNDFLQYVEYYAEKNDIKYSRIRDYLKINSEGTSADNFQIYGLVVTGRTEDLQKLQHLSYARAISLGTTIEAK